MARKDLTTAVIAVLTFTVLLGLGYPLLVTGISQVAMPDRANGSRVERDGRLVGSRILGQDFKNRPGYFQARPSATEYDAAATAFSNRGPNQASLAAEQRGRLEDYLERERPTSPRLRAPDVPADAVTTSASGVDPHISPADARIQAARVASARNFPRGRVLALVAAHTDGRAFGFAGEPGVNVLELNLALDREAPR
jgi:K+-transporting ATPase ATPase C chain